MLSCCHVFLAACNVVMLSCFLAACNVVRCDAISIDFVMTY